MSQYDIRAGLVAIVVLSAPMALAKERIWMAPLSSVTSDKIGATDFMDMFQPDAPWKETARATSVFKLYPYFVGRTSDENLRIIFGDLARRGISLALEARALTSTSGCKMSSGDGGASTINLLNRIRRLGGELKFLAMDEPLKHGLLGEKSCRATVERIAEDVVANIHSFRRVFPDLQVGDIEPIGTWRNAPTLLEDTLTFVDVYEQKAGEKLAFLHADVGWSLPWVKITDQLGEALRNRKVPFGVIYNGDDPSPSDDAWTEETARHFRQFEDCRRSAPDDAIFQTWRIHPQHILPETNPYTLTGIAKRYIDRTGCQSKNKSTNSKGAIND